MAGVQQDRDDDGDPEDDVEAPPRQPWSSSAQAIAAVAWSSFLAACLATMVFFAFIDPGMIHEATTPQVRITRMTGYGVGFFFFWLVCAIASGVSVYLIRTSHLQDRDRDGGHE